MTQRKPYSWEYPDLDHPSVTDSVLILPINDKGGIVHDQSGRLNHGTNNGATWTSGENGPALSFSRTSLTYLNLGLMDFRSEPGFTFICRINFNVAAGGAEYTIFDNKQDNFRHGTLLRIEPATNTLEFESVQEGGLVTVNATDLTLTPGVSTHIAATIKVNGTMEVYVDGVRSAEFAAFGDWDVTANAKDMFIGDRNGAAADELDGIIEYLSFYNKALTAAEIQELVNFPWKAWEQDNIALWASQGGVPPVGAYMPQIQKANLGAKLYNGTLVA